MWRLWPSRLSLDCMFFSVKLHAFRSKYLRAPKRVMCFPRRTSSHDSSHDTMSLAGAHERRGRTACSWRQVSGRARPGPVPLPWRSCCRTRIPPGARHARAGQCSSARTPAHLSALRKQPRTRGTLQRSPIMTAALCTVVYRTRVRTSAE